MFINIDRKKDNEYQTHINIYLRENYDNDQSGKKLKYLIWIIYEISLLTIGFHVDEPSILSAWVKSIDNLGFSINGNNDQDKMIFNI